MEFYAVVDILADRVDEIGEELDCLITELKTTEYNEMKENIERKIMLLNMEKIQIENAIKLLNSY